MAASNGHYAASIRLGQVYIEDLNIPEPHDEPRRLSLPALAAHSVLSLSTVQPRLLAISSGTQILVYDLAADRLYTSLKGNGRIVTALVWSVRQSDLLASGAIDGSLSIWALTSRELGSPVAQLRARGVCRAIACSPTDATIFASIHDGEVIVSKRISGHNLRQVKSIALEGETFISLSWHPTEHERLLVGAERGSIYLWNLAFVLEAISGFADSLDSESSDSEPEIFGKLDGINGSMQDMFEIASSTSLVEVRWAGKDAFLCLTSHGTRCILYRWDEAKRETYELWSADLKEHVRPVIIVGEENNVALVGISSSSFQRLAIPQDIINEVGLDTMASTERSHGTSDAAHEQKQQALVTTIGMTPVSISTLRAMEGNFAKTSKQLQQRRPSFKRRLPRVPDRKHSRAEKKRAASPPPSTSMTSSLELPKQNGGESSPMPFLSPSIPSQEPSPGDLSPLDDSIKLSPLPRGSFDSSMHSTSAATQESDDSDDETFVDAMQSSATFLPGGINVPLPKACAALFAPTGQLLTFFPPKPKLAVKRSQGLEQRQPDPKASAKKVAKLFPSFGNLVGDSAHPLNDEDDSGFESTSSVSSDVVPLRHHSSFSFVPSSFPSQQSWRSRVSPTKHSFTEQSLHKVMVSVYNTSGIESLVPASRQLAVQYRFVCEQEESCADLCRHNADAANANGWSDVAGIWSLTAVLLDHPTSLEIAAGSCDRNDVRTLARLANDVVQSNVAGTVFNNGKHGWSKEARGVVRHRGAAWTARSIFDWAECQADIQLLAVLSAVFAPTHGELPSSDTGNKRVTRAPSHSDRRDCFRSARTEQLPILADQAVPALDSHARSTITATYESPVKPKRTSNVSSRNPSQPPTPYLESDPGTPPFSLPPLGRQGTRLSTSGSASPEHHRSSFSAAAKYYAQSISDKFASYGAYSASPPARRMGTSPGSTNELSTSFPPGSWGKSVSFASTTNTAKASLLSTSFEEANEDEGYDSDKTVEDLSQPQTPRDNAECIVTLKNNQLFDNDSSGGSKPALLSDDMLPQCRHWCNYYAEQLRCWDLLPQAAELEKVIGTTCLRDPAKHRPRAQETSVLPIPASQTSKACSICTIRMRSMQFSCPSCLHSAHLGCLEDFIRALYVEGADGEAFACPTGCGCRCDDLPFGVVSVEVVRGEDKPRKKASFTDPRRWRARVEGNSW